MTPEEIFARAAETGKELGLSYAGAMPPPEAAALHEGGHAALVDVRTAAELVYTGTIPGSVAVEWQTFPDMSVNPRFAEQLQEQVSAAAPVLFICRSGARSHHAAAAACNAGYRAYNILEGFEGDLNAERHRNTINGWRARGLAWIQS